MENTDNINYGVENTTENFFEEGKLHRTYNYEMFARIRGNRVINKLKVNDLVSYMSRTKEETGCTTGLVPPAYVNLSKELVDGQHRREACKILGLPFEYIVLNDEAFKNKIEHIVAINKGAKWTTRNYIESYVELGYENYLKFNEFRNAYPDIKHINIYISLMELKEGTKGRYDNIKNGELIIPNYKKSCDLADKLYDYREAGKILFKKVHFLGAAYRMITYPGYVHSKMVRKLVAKGTQLKLRNDLRSYCEMLTDFYNMNLDEGNKIYPYLKIKSRYRNF